LNVYLNQQKIKLSPQQSIGKGGEAEVFRLKPGIALKLFKTPTHPDFKGLSQAQQMAQERLAIHQSKLRQFPTHLPSRVIAPQSLVTDRQGKQIFGYTMPLLDNTEVLLRYSNRAFRQTVEAQTVVEIFQDLHSTVSKLHRSQVVIGDFNDLNVLVKGTEAYLIDADSFQFGSYPCRMFTARFVDPVLCDPQANQPLLQQPHTANSDWYAFTVMLMQCLLFVDPYGGLHKPQDPHQRVPQAARALKRITVFHPEVRYPKPALPYGYLPDELLHHFHEVFQQDWRGRFPNTLLNNLRWTTCTRCGVDHARTTCPACSHTSPGAKLSTTVVRGQVIATRLFQTEGVILHAREIQGTLRWVYWEHGKFKQEDGQVLLTGNRLPYTRWRIQADKTLLGSHQTVVTFPPEASNHPLATDSYRQVTQFDVNDRHCYWIAQGHLLRDHHRGPVLGSLVMGEVLSGGQTRFWVGPAFGLGFYQAGGLKVAFVFDAERPGINDRVLLPAWQGELVQASCTFSRDYGWLFLTIHQQGQMHYHCVVIGANGQVLAAAQTTDQDSWLTTLVVASTADPCPHCAVNHFLLAATDDGIVRIEVQQGQLCQTKVFPGTESFVEAGYQLLAGQDGLFVVSPHQIQWLKLVP
jgi:hypothetical protein